MLLDCALTVFDFDNLFGGHTDLLNQVLHIVVFRSLFQVIFDLVFIPGIGMNDVPGGLVAAGRII